MARRGFFVSIAAHTGNAVAGTFFGAIFGGCACVFLRIIVFACRVFAVFGGLRL